MRTFMRMVIVPARLVNFRAREARPQRADFWPESIKCATTTLIYGKTINESSIVTAAKFV